MNIFTLASRELRSLFLSPLAWSILAVVQFLYAYLFMGRLEGFLQIQARLSLMEKAPDVTELVIIPVFANIATILLLVIPLLTMRLISEERRSRSLSLLLSAPLSMSEIILGKYLGLLGFILCLLLLLLLTPLSLLGSGSLDFGLLFSAWLALLLLAAAFAAAGLFMSSLTQYPTLAAITSFGLLLLLWLFNMAANNVGDDGSTSVLAYLSLLTHYENLIRGVINSADILYYLLFITGFLVLSIRRLDGERLQA
ncbi:MAG: ABC transporter permease subunit [Gammaproteobacteria bacterium]|nr:ABC transporter permease subunit [Gammaproteobacteria bacterium]